jgi:endonuclease/exonuclease/phosphatase family metal-dependent hydrolase
MDERGVEKIAGALHYNYIYYPAVKHPLYNRNFGNAILSKWPIVFDQKVILPHLDPDKLQRIAVGAVIKVGSKYVMAYSVHLRIWLHPFQRKNQMDRLLNSLPDHFDYCIVAGDFNTFTKFNRSVIFDAFKEHGFRLATENVDWTYKHWYLFNKKSLMDYIFVKNFEVSADGRGSSRKASDHVPIWAEFKFEEL